MTTNEHGRVIEQGGGKHYEYWLRSDGTLELAHEGFERPATREFAIRHPDYVMLLTAIATRDDWTVECVFCAPDGEPHSSRRPATKDHAYRLSGLERFR